ncbi:hypothetical protein [Ekhidna sp.]|uniref:hypothetical protein n=1 Tax=Ekhidna sp. TaxID=2608089 RepID=UPI003299622B
MKNSLLICSLIFLSSCYDSLSIDGFDKNQWVNYEKNCSTYRLDKVQLIIDNQEVLLKGTQNAVESVLGKASEHELYDRNQKFFHYRLTPPNGCEKSETIKYLSIRFNAIGRANLVQIMLREPQ